MRRLHSSRCSAIAPQKGCALWCCLCSVPEILRTNPEARPVAYTRVQVLRDEVVVTVADDDFEELPPHEPAWAVLDRVSEYRKTLPASRLLAGARHRQKSPTSTTGSHARATTAIIDTWAMTRADHLSTGVLAFNTPFIDHRYNGQTESPKKSKRYSKPRSRAALSASALPPKRADPVSGRYAIQEDGDAI